MNKYVCIHSHFYQPPRENPWLDQIEQQDSAAPFHDWNERIASECYRENGRSKIVNGRNYVIGVSNNYARMNFNFGPTLHSWLEHHDKRTYDYIIKGDIASKERFNGHGNAIAQCYNHIIMPLANRRDKETQIVWGIKDFEKRFNRYPEAMWLPETAVDLESLEIMAQYHLKYVILAPRQASKVRALNSSDWTDVSSENINTHMPYLIKLPSGGEIAAFFYDGMLSKAVAFDGLLHNGDTLAKRIVESFSNANAENQLVHIATDGESYGHHHKYGDMALAYALKKMEDDSHIKLCNYGYYLEIQPPTFEVQIFENSSWSCVHGVERWKSDCGCNTGGNPAWNQKWRSPLRQTLNELRDQVNEKFEISMKKFKIDPWLVRNDYVNTFLNRTEKSNQDFVKKWIPDFNKEEDQIEFVKSFELQRQMQLMFTSCAWFFDEVSGIETVQVLQYALRAVELAENLWGSFLMEKFLANLKMIPSNIPLYGNAYGIYQQIVKKCEIDFFAIAAHYAVASLFKEQDPVTPLYCYDVKKTDLERIKVGRNRFVCGHAEFRSRSTYSKKHIMFAAVHLGENIVSAGVSLLTNVEEYHVFKSNLREKVETADVTSYMREFDKRFKEKIFTLKDLLADDRAKLAKDTLYKKMERIDAQYLRIYNDNFMLVSYLSSLKMEIPEQLKSTFEYVINKMIIQLFNDKIENFKTQELMRYMQEITEGHFELKTSNLEKFFQERLIAFSETIGNGQYNQTILANFLFAVKFATNIAPTISLSEIQCVMFKWREGFEALPPEYETITHAIFDALKIEHFKS